MKKKEPIRSSQAIIVAGLLILSFVLHWKDKVVGSYVLLGIALVLGIIFVLIPSWGRRIVQGWFALAKGLGWINSRILLSIIFFCVLTPISLLRRLGGRDPLQRKNKKRKTLFVTRNHTYEKKDMKYGW